MDYFGEDLDQQEACVVCLYTFEKLSQLLDIASQCQDSLEFHYGKEPQLWTPNQHHLLKLNYNLGLTNKYPNNDFAQAKIVPRTPIRVPKLVVLKPIVQTTIPIGPQHKINEQTTSELRAFDIKNYQNGSQALDDHGKQIQKSLTNWTNNFTNNLKKVKKDDMKEFFLRTLSKLTLEQYPDQGKDLFMRKYFADDKQEKAFNKIREMYNLLSDNSTKNMEDYKNIFYSHGLENYWEEIKNKSRDEVLKWLNKYFPSLALQPRFKQIEEPKEYFDKNGNKYIINQANKFRFKQISNIINYETNTANYENSNTVASYIENIYDNRGKNATKKQNDTKDDNPHNDIDDKNHDDDKGNQTDVKPEQNQTDSNSTQKLLTYIDIRHPRTMRIIDRNRGTVNTQTDLGDVEKNTFLPPADKKQLYEVEHKLDHHFRESDEHEHFKTEPNQEGYDREFGSLEHEIKHYLEPGPRGYKEEKGGRTDYKFDTHLRTTSKQKQVKTNSDDGLRVNNLNYPYGATTHLRFKETEDLTLTELLQSDKPDQIKEYFEKKEKKNLRFSDKQIMCAYEKMRAIVKQICQKNISKSFKKYCNLFLKQQRTVVESLLFYDKPQQICKNIFACQ